MKRFWILAGAVVVTLAALALAMLLGAASFDFRRFAQHEGRLAKVMRGERSVYVLPETLGGLRRAPSDERLRRILADIPVVVGRSGLILVLTGQPGTANVIAQAIEESTLDGFVGTVAGDNTLIVLFPEESALVRWLERFQTVQATAEAAAVTEALAR